MEVLFRYSDSNFCAYLNYLGFEVIGFDIVEKRGNKPKVFLHYKGNREEFIEIYQKYKSNNISINLIEFGKCKNNILKTVRELLGNYLRSKK
jgi:hypothetical protein